MRHETVIGIHHLHAGERRVPVVLRRTHAGRVAAQCLLENEERPIVDGESVSDVLRVLEDALEALLLARRRRSPP